jgi:hypothetical protein
MQRLLRLVLFEPTTENLGDIPCLVRCVLRSRLAGFVDLKLVVIFKLNLRTNSDVEKSCMKYYTDLQNNSRQGSSMSPAALRRLPSRGATRD